MEFSFHLPTKVVFGFGALDRLGAEVASLGAGRALVVTDKVMVKTGAVEKVLSKAPSLSAEVFDGVEPEPRIEVADAVAEKVRAGRYEMVIGVGGGSSMDMAKVAAAFATNDRPAREYVGNNLFGKRPLAAAMLPTTAGTGAELTATSMVTVDGHKRWINSPLLMPSLAIVDPELTVTMPQSVTAATGMDALCHNTESYLSAAANAVTDAAALEGVRLIASNLERAFDAGGDRPAREAMSLGALLGGIALQGKMVYGHSIGYTVATRFRLAHGVSCGLPLPYIIAAYAVACAPKMKRLAAAFGMRVDDPAEAGLAVAERVKGTLSHLKMPTSMEELGVKEEELPALAKECIQMYPRPNSPMVFDEKSMAAFYRQMWEGRFS